MLNTDLEVDGKYPPVVEAFRQRILVADSILFASPDYCAVRFLSYHTGQLIFSWRNQQQWMNFLSCCTKTLLFNSCSSIDTHSRLEEALFFDSYLVVNFALVSQNSSFSTLYMCLNCIKVVSVFPSHLVLIFFLAKKITTNKYVLT
ncbi:uncharacterized protein [Gossypium hirsutum]|uniref:Uncharacterized protein n=1 Tax=Gossypium hirsutum TaxID=3635 RepID=A0ABM3BFT9_GOSHI|nr:uncharacterized protein LOC121225618 [Gossypium hirsutum]